MWQGCWLFWEAVGCAGRLLVALGVAGYAGEPGRVLALLGDSFPVVHAAVCFLLT